VATTLLIEEKEAALDGVPVVMRMDIALAPLGVGVAAIIALLRRRLAGTRGVAVLLGAAVVCEPDAARL
jgi:hypothetical protein